MTTWVRRGDVRSELLAAAEEALPVFEAQEVVDAVLDRLLAPDVMDELVRTATVALSRAWTAHDLRDDLYACPDGPEPTSRIVLNALAHAVGERPPDPPVSAAEAAAVLSEVAYKDYTFDLLRLPDGTWGVRVEGRFPDSRKPQHRVAVSARGFGRASILDCAFRAVMALEEHEARERFTYRGERVFDPHRDTGDEDPIPAPMAEPPLPH
jgi:hypothetical protein